MRSSTRVVFANCLLSSSSSDSFNCKALDKKVGLDDESFTSDFFSPFNCNALEKSADYASYLGTNWNKSLQPSILQRKHMADTLGVGAVVVTSDQYIIFIKRSEHVGEFPNCLDVPGGHPEPSRVTGLQTYTFITHRTTINRGSLECTQSWQY